MAQRSHGLEVEGDKLGLACSELRTGELATGRLGYTSYTGTQSHETRSYRAILPYADRTQSGEHHPHFQASFCRMTSAAPDSRHR